MRNRRNRMTNPAVSRQKKKDEPDESISHGLTSMDTVFERL